MASIVFLDFNNWRKFFDCRNFGSSGIALWKQQTQKNSKTCMSVCQYVSMSVNSSFKISYIYRSDNNQQTTSIRSGVDFSVGKYPKFSERSGSHGSPTFRKKKVMDQNGLLSELGHIRWKAVDFQRWKLKIGVYTKTVFCIFLIEEKLGSGRIRKDKIGSDRTK